MVVVATTVAAMTELPAPDSTGPTPAERLAALRKPAEKRGKPAHTTKILAAGLSTTALFGMVAAMGWPTATETAKSAPLQAMAAAPAVAVVAPTTPTTVPTVPTVPTVLTVAPVAPVAVPAAIPVVSLAVQNASVRTASNTVTKTSG